jgi:metacaspase-1
MNRALLVGINAYPASPLKGCLNDISDMAGFLTSRCNFAMDDIRMLTDSRATKAGILERLGWLLTGLQKGDRILFHYSGHGVQLPTRNPQGEVDGLDEAICPYDFDWTNSHTIRDKEFSKIFSSIPDGVMFIWISDSCHSGDLEREIPRNKFLRKTIDLPLDINWRLQTAKQKKIKPFGFIKVAQSLNLALISGCKSDQTSADAEFNDRYNGALTYFLLERLNKKDGLKKPLAEIVKEVNLSLKKNGYEQESQLEGNEMIKNKPFLNI